jgi:hypothetical protein
MRSTATVRIIDRATVSTTGERITLNSKPRCQFVSSFFRSKSRSRLGSRGMFCVTGQLTWLE